MIATNKASGHPRPDAPRTILADDCEVLEAAAPDPVEEPDAPAVDAARLNVGEPQPSYDVIGGTVDVVVSAPEEAVTSISVAVLLAPGMLVPVGMAVISPVAVAFRAAVAMATWLLATS